MRRQTSVKDNILIWFGAGLSIAEIITGTYFADLGLVRGMLAILIGHSIGCLLLFLSGLIGGKTGLSSMETVKLSFGRGGRFFAFLNVLQLTGWTAIMIYDGALAAAGVFSLPHWLWCLITGGLIIVWLAVGLENLGKINAVAMGALFAITLILSCLVFGGVFSDSIIGGAVHRSCAGGLSFGAAVELAVAMPLSWMPLISDYTSRAEKPITSSAASALTYFFISCWMYVIGLGAALFTGESDIAQIFLKAGLGIAGLVIIVFSTVTTTFLDAWSAGVSSESVKKGIKGRHAAFAAAVFGTAAAVAFPMDDITDFLYLIGSVFAPMAAIQLADFFVLRGCLLDKNSLSGRSLRPVPVTMLIWAAGFVIYRLLMYTELTVGNTLPDMVITAILCVSISSAYKGRVIKKSEKR